MNGTAQITFVAEFSVYCKILLLAKKMRHLQGKRRVRGAN